MSFRVEEEAFPDISGFVRRVRCADCGAALRVNVAHQDTPRIATALFECMALEFERFIRAHECAAANRWVPMTAERVAEMAQGPIGRVDHCGIKDDADDAED